MKSLETEFKKLNIDTSSIGFYDDPNFLKVEQRDNRFLEKYGEYVLSRGYNSDYIQRCRYEIPIISKILNDELQKDVQMGACINLSMVLSRILEKEGFWNYITKGAMTIKFDETLRISDKHFWNVDINNFQTGHSWVVSPSFNVIDLTLQQQPYKLGEEKYITDFICSESDQEAKVNEIDVISNDASLIMTMQGVKNKFEHCKEGFSSFIKKFRPIEVKQDLVTIKYITTGVSVCDGPLEDISTIKLSDRYGYEIYNDIVKPRLRDIRTN